MRQCNTQLTLLLQVYMQRTAVLLASLDHVRQWVFDIMQRCCSSGFPSLSFPISCSCAPSWSCPTNSPACRGCHNSIPCMFPNTMSLIHALQVRYLSWDKLLKASQQVWVVSAPGWALQDTQHGRLQGVWVCLAWMLVLAVACWLGTTLVLGS